MKATAVFVLISTSLLFAQMNSSQHKGHMQGNMKQYGNMEMTGEQAHTMVKLPTVQCGSCKQTIESGLSKVKGIQMVHVDVEKKMAHINYDSGLLTLDEIEQAIVALGYQANDTPADSDAYDNLMACCKMPD